MTAPYYADDQVTLYHGDCLKVTDWLAADVLVTDPPYGLNWRGGRGMTNANGYGCAKGHPGIAGDRDTSTRDTALAQWAATSGRPGVVFGDLIVAAPADAVQCLVYAKASDAGIRGARGGFRRDAEGIYLIGNWPARVGGQTSILTSRSWVAGPSSPAYKYGHPHAKPVDLLEQLIIACPPGTIADPFAGSGSTLIAARNQGRKAIGVELEESYCELIATRLDQLAFDFGA